jgi:hypothetical protein
MNYGRGKAVGIFTRRVLNRFHSEFLVQAIPERLAHLMLYQLQRMVAPNAIFFLDTQSNPTRGVAFANLVRSSLSHLDRFIQTPSTSTKKRRAYDDAAVSAAVSNG